MLVSYTSLDPIVKPRTTILLQEPLRTWILAAGDTAVATALPVIPCERVPKFRFDARQ